MNRKVDRTKFQVLAGILKEANLYEQGQDPFTDYSSLHHSYAEEDFERRELAAVNEDEYSMLEVDLSHLSEDAVDTVLATLRNSTYYRNTLGFDHDMSSNSILIGTKESIPAGEVQAEIKRLYDLLKSNTGEEGIAIEELFL